MPYNFCRENKQQMFNWLWKFKSNTLINNNFIIKYFKYTWYGHPAQSPIISVIFHNVIVYECYFLYFNTLLARYTQKLIAT